MRIQGSNQELYHWLQVLPNLKTSLSIVSQCPLRSTWGSQNLVCFMGFFSSLHTDLKKKPRTLWFEPVSSECETSVKSTRLRHSSNPTKKKKLTDPSVLGQWLQTSVYVSRQVLRCAVSCIALDRSFIQYPKVNIWKCNLHKCSIHTLHSWEGAVQAVVALNGNYR